MAGVLLRESAGVDAHLGGWQGEDQPATLQLDELELEHVAEESAIGFGLLAIQEKMNAIEHRESLSDRFTVVVGAAGGLGGVRRAN